VRSLKQSNIARDVQLYYLAEQVYNITRAIHNDLIGDGIRRDQLNYLSTSLNNNIEIVLINFRKKFLITLVDKEIRD
jgi:hypothetical protein